MSPITVSNDVQLEPVADFALQLTARFTDQLHLYETFSSHYSKSRRLDTSKDPCHWMWLGQNTTIGPPRTTNRQFFSRVIKYIVNPAIVQLNHNLGPYN